MKSFIKIFGIVLSLSLFLTQCKDDDTQIFRAYAEGKISFTDEKFLEDPIHLVKDKKIIAETYPKESGSFVLAGPYDKGEYQLSLKRFKIKSFNTNVSGCKISSDSLSIIIPNGTTYIIFDNIQLK